MSHSAASRRFCSQCGELAAEGANFCTACGARLLTEGAPARRRSAPEFVGLVVLLGFLAIGLGLWFSILRPKPPPGRMPLATKSPEATASAQALPENHPPVEIPADVQRFIADLQAKADASPKDPATWKTLGDVAYRAGQIDRSYLSKAEQAFGHVLELDPKDVDALRGIGNVHYDREEYPKARAAYQRYLEIKPDEASVRTDLGTMYLYDGHEDEAITEYRKVLAAAPNFYQAHFNLGVAWARKGDRDQAIAELSQAKTLAPDEPTKAQIQQMIERASGVAAAPETAQASGLRGRIERTLRGHPIVGPKIAGFEWPSDSSGRVLLDDFPMQAMPEAVRTKFLDHLKRDLSAAKRESGASGSASLELVDHRTGELLARIEAD